MEKTTKQKSTTKADVKKLSSMPSIHPIENSPSLNLILSKLSLDETKKTKSIGLLKNAKKKIDDLNSLFSYKNFFLDEKKPKPLKSVAIRKIKNSEEEIGFSNNINLNINNFKKILGTQQDYESYDISKKPNILNYHKEDAELMVNLLDRLKIKKTLNSYNNFGIKNLFINNENNRKNQEILAGFTHLIFKNYETDADDYKETQTLKNTTNFLKNQSKVSVYDQKQSQDNNITNDIYNKNYSISNIDNLPKFNFYKKIRNKSRQITTNYKDETFLGKHLSTSKQTTNDDVMKTETTQSKSKNDIYLKTYSESLKSKTERQDQKKWITSYTNYKKTNFKEFETIKFSPSNQSMNFNLRNLNLIENSKNNIQNNGIVQKNDLIKTKDANNTLLVNNSKNPENFISTSFSDNEKMFFFRNKKNLACKISKNNENKQNPNSNFKKKTEFILQEFYNILNLEELRAKLIMKKKR
jgi:hypothetical protein